MAKNRLHFLKGEVGVLPRHELYIPVLRRQALNDDVHETTVRNRLLHLEHYTLQ